MAKICTSTVEKISMKIEAIQENSNKMACATSKDSDQTAHVRSLIRAFAGRLDLFIVSYP